MKLFIINCLFLFNVLLANELSIEDLKQFNESINSKMTYSETAWKNELDKFTPSQIEKRLIGDCVAYATLKAYILARDYNIDPNDLNIIYLKGKRDLDALWNDQMWSQDVKAYDEESNHMTLEYKGKILDYKFHNSLDSFLEYIKQTERIDYKVIKTLTWKQEEQKQLLIAKMNQVNKQRAGRKLTDAEFKENLEIVAKLNDMSYKEYVLSTYGLNKGNEILNRLKHVVSAQSYE